MKLTAKTTAITLAAMAVLAAPLAFGRAAQADNHGGRGCQRLTEQLDLSDAQATQIETIKDQSRDQMRGVLTEDQQATLEGSENNGRRAWRQLDLTDEQKEQLQAIRQSTRDEVRAVLTEEQQAQFDTLREQRRQRRSERRGQRQDSRSDQ